MKPIFYDIPLIQQGLQECAQACTVQLLHFYGIPKTIEEVKKEVPVFISKDRVPVGTSMGHIATYILQQGFSVTMHMVDVDIFDRSWKNFSNEELIKYLNQRRKFVKHAEYDNYVLDAVFDGYYSFLKAGGTVKFPIVDEQYLYNVLESGPFFVGVHYNFLNDVSKYYFDKKESKAKKDSIQGVQAAHEVIAAGYKEGKFLIIDPDYDLGGERWIDASILVASFYLAAVNYDALLISVKKLLA